jgi:hypothetical protein
VVAEVKPEPEPVMKPEPAVVEGAAQSVSQNKGVEQSAEVTQIAGHSEQSRSTTVRRSTLSQFSIRSLMDEAEQEESSVKPAKRVESEDTNKMSEERLMAAREQIIADILEWRPRFVEFHEMAIAGNVISVKVGSQTLYEEIMRNRTELLTLVMRSVGAKGAVELNVIVDEKIQAARPIKLEDRRVFLIEKNPKLLDLKAALELEFE